MNLVNKSRDKRVLFLKNNLLIRSIIEICITQINVMWSHSVVGVEEGLEMEMFSVSVCDCDLDNASQN